MMHTRLSLLAVAVALAIAGAARAETISLVWQANGSNSIDVPSSVTITADIVLRITSSDLTAIGWNISWDDELAYQMSTLVVGPGAVVPGTNWQNTSQLYGPGNSAGTQPGTQRVYQFAGDSGATMTPGVATVGTVTFHVTPNVVDDGAPGIASGSSTGPAPISGDVSADFINTTFGVGCFTETGEVECTVIIGASVNVPEPGTLTLLALGLAGLGLAGSRRGS